MDGEKKLSKSRVEATVAKGDGDDAEKTDGESRTARKAAQNVAEEIALSVLRDAKDDEHPITLNGETIING